MNLQNLTPPESGIAQHLEGGQVVLVAKYYRNPCYEPDLSGERKPNGGRWNGCQERDLEEYFNVSQEQFLEALEAQGEVVEKTFEFERPIPLNVVELEFQVVYRGKMGGEEAVAIGTEVISETTYSSWMNHTDYFPIDGGFYRPETILGNSKLKKRWEAGGKPSLVPASIWVEIQNGRVVGRLSPGTYFRLAMLIGESVKLAYVADFDHVGQLSGFHSILARQDFRERGPGFYQVRESWYWYVLHFYFHLGIGPIPSSEAFDDIGTLLKLEPLAVDLDF